MTCIIGIVSDKKIYFGSDRCITYGFEKTETIYPKIWSTQNHLFGVAGSPRMSDLIQYNLGKIPTQFVGKMHIVTEVLPMIYDILSKYNQIPVDEESVEDMNSDILIGYYNRIYYIDSQFSVISNIENLHTIGSGSHVALGAMIALENLEPMKRIEKSLEITSKVITNVSSNYDILYL